ncbi:hypothetical protein CQ12_28650 [Bradyrhizobium jicamae]|uniref:Uncharacterized protein n=1 Tax=Bradyrhizobium jicamae TaxID=280332 RepID=A0A0R3MCC3_9BRAD|nr:hypothetical protein [Bradyrhizobium jicamae]KRR14838.1 hypothetical protein CQ12_28650 [Bradyrhizobium jicamae]
MLDLAERIVMAQRHVETGQGVIVRQRNIVARKHGRGVDASGAEELLARFEQCQAIFENNLERLLLEREPHR